MPVLHIFNNWLFTAPYVNFINKNYKPEDHRFFIIKSKGKMKIPDQDNVLNFVVENSEKKNKLKYEFKKFNTYLSLFFYCLRAEKIIVHGLFDKSIIKFLFYNQWFLSKTDWVVWGADLHYTDKLKRKNKRTDKKEKMKISLIRKLHGIIGLTQGDAAAAVTKYRSKAKEFLGMYINTITSDYLDTLKPKVENTCNIQIGNSADPSNHHIEIIDSIKRFSNEDIKIYVPLTYGDSKYAEEVQNYGKKIFGKKFIAMTEFLQPEEYSQYLADIDIMIYDHKRQQGLGNIYSLIYMGKKVFIRDDISSWDFLNTTLDIKVFNTIDISKIDFAEFVQYSDQVKEHNMQRANETFYSNKFIKDLWAKIFREDE